MKLGTRIDVFARGRVKVGQLGAIRPRVFSAMEDISDSFTIECDFLKTLN
jgi:hypothetical protein